MPFWGVCFWKQAFFVYGMRSMWNRTGSRDDINLEHAFWFLVWQVVTAFGLLRRKDKCTSPKSLKKRYPVTQQFAYIINQPKYSIRQLRHLRQYCSDFSISPYWDYLQLPGRANERGLDVLIADVFCTFFNTWSCMESRIWKYLAIWLYLFEKHGLSRRDLIFKSS